ncbi:MAG: hypothetical protein JNL10_08355 [Verrucomicrobiales bacterium]|nr:hypothetical protein [Verrucomicrobiales bacterium]
MKPTSAPSLSLTGWARIRRGLAWIALGLGLITVPALTASPIVSGLVRSSLDPETKGLILIEELGCVSCHSAGGTLASRSKKAPRLSDLGDRVHPAFLLQFLRDPHETQPGTTMPDLLAHLDAGDREPTATALSHFLLSGGSGRFTPGAPDAVAARQGFRLFHGRGCAQCHAPRDEQGRERPGADSAPLGALERKYDLQGLIAFLQHPHTIRPSGRMPDLRLQARDAERIAHFLLQDTRVPGALGYTRYRGPVWEGIGSDEVTAERAGLVRDFNLQSLGDVHHHTAIRYEGRLRINDPGRHTFHLRVNGGLLELDGKRLAQLDPSDRRGVESLEGAADLDAGWHRIRLDYYHTGEEPSFSFEIEGPHLKRQPIPASLLSISDQPIPVFVPFQVESALAARGREAFGALGCANCHDDLKVSPRTAPELAKLNPDRGCLSTNAGAWPRFDLSEQQRNWIAMALPHAGQPSLNDALQLDKTLVTFNCIACHERTGLGGIAADRNALFTGSQPALGDQGRLPPPLTQVGAKLTREGIADVLLHGHRERGYLDASMPQFGEANVGHLVDLLGAVDTLEAAPIPALTDIPAAKSAGRELVGSSGLACIACHEFHGQKSGEVGALDLSHVTGRLRKNWFHLYLRQPARFHPTVIMPAYWPDGRSGLTNLLGGDAGRQIEALWTYLEDGDRARNPTGLARTSHELRVSDTPELCRGQSPAGYRGIAVGYPERIHLAFDSGEMALRRLWKGEFVSIDDGSFQPRGTDTISFPPGIPFHRLASPDAPWPYKGKSNHAFPQDHGYVFRGYHLDAMRRPTLLYRYGDIAVEDYFEDVRAPDGPAYFRRTLRFDAPAGQPAFQFRVAVGKQVRATDGREFIVDRLNLRITSGHRGTVRTGDPGEVLIPLQLPEGRSTLTLEYRW